MPESEMSQPSLDAIVIESKQTIKELFGIVGIKKAIVVDDDWSETLTIEDLFGALTVIALSGDYSKLDGICELERIDLDSPGEIWRPIFEGIWAGLDDSAKIRIALALDVNLITDESEPRGILFNLLDDYQPMFLSHTKWMQEGDTLLKAASDAPTVFLFDQDMSKNDGPIDQGMRTISSLLNSGTPTGSSAYFALFSNGVTGNNEYEKLEKFAEEYSLQDKKNRFAVVSKEHLRTNPKLLAARLKRVIISPICEDLKSKLFTAVSGATEDARKKVDELNIYDFEQMVFQSSYKEGVWEPDTLLRIFGLYYREAARTRAQQNSELHALANKVRTVIGVPYLPDDRPESRSHVVQRLELYEQEDYLLFHKMPVDIGDIFQKTGGNRQYILLGQPCALMVRGENGKRNKIQEVTVAPIVHKPKDEILSPAFIELPFYSLDSHTRAYVYLEEGRQIPLCILDLCVFNAEGHASISATDVCPPGVIPAWQLRFEILKGQAISMIERFKAIKPSLTGPQGRQTLQLLQASLTQSVSGLVRGEILENPDRVTYDIKRVARMKQPRAGSLLRDFAEYSARDAFDHDLTRTLTKG